MNYKKFIAGIYHQGGTESSMDHISQPTKAILNPSNYFEWKIEITLILRSKGPYRVTMGTENYPTSAVEKINYFTKFKALLTELQECGFKKEEDQLIPSIPSKLGSARTLFFATEEEVFDPSSITSEQHSKQYYGSDLEFHENFMVSQTCPSSSNIQISVDAGGLVDDPLVTRRASFQCFGAILVLDSMVALLIIILCK